MIQAGKSNTDGPTEKRTHVRDLFDVHYTVHAQDLIT